MSQGRPLRVLGIGGSVRKDSLSGRLLRTILAQAAERGAETDIADIHLMQLPIFDNDVPLARQPQAVLDMIAQMQWADAFVVCSPTYLGSLSGAVKNALDSLHAAHGTPGVYFEGRPVALATYGHHGTENVIQSLALVTHAMGARLVHDGVIVGSDDLADGTFATDHATRQIDQLVAALLQSS